MSRALFEYGERNDTYSPRMVVLEMIGKKLPDPHALLQKRQTCDLVVVKMVLKSSIESIDIHLVTERHPLQKLLSSRLMNFAAATCPLSTE